MRVRWTPRARADLREISEYLDVHLPNFLQSTVVSLCEAIDSLFSSPYRGRPGREPGTRELVMTRIPYIVAYRVRSYVVEVLHIHHTSRQWPESNG
jgi:plasmid stabilization system protein ParE